MRLVFIKLKRNCSHAWAKLLTTMQTVSKMARMPKISNKLNILLSDRKAELLANLPPHTEENCLSKMVRMTLCLSKILSFAASIKTSTRSKLYKND